jgi:hypothetical protein
VPRVKYPMEYRLKNSFSMGCASRKVIFPGIRLTERLRLLFLLLGPAFLEIPPTTDPIISRILPVTSFSRLRFFSLISISAFLCSLPSSVSCAFSCFRRRSSLLIRSLWVFSRQSMANSGVLSSGSSTVYLRLWISSMRTSAMASSSHPRFLSSESSTCTFWSPSKASGAWRFFILSG